MAHIGRRGVLTSLAARAALTGLAKGALKGDLTAAEPEVTTLGEPSEAHWGWLIAQERCNSAEPACIDFWSMPLDGISYADYLPAQIRRGLVSYEVFPRGAGATNAMVLYKDKDENHRGWFDLRKLERFVSDPEGSQDFGSMLALFGKNEGAPARTALMALDTTSNTYDDYWQRILLPAFRRYYGSTIGLKHFRNRGLCQQRAFYKRNFTQDYFEHDFVQPATLCDATIVTSEGLIETDFGLCPRASTKTLAGELVRRVSHALLDPQVQNRIIGRLGIGTRKSRLYALGSATLNVHVNPLVHLQMMLDRQVSFVANSFSPLAVDDLPLFIATTIHDDAEFRSAVIDILARAAFMGGYSFDPDMVATVQAPRYLSETRRSVALDLIAFWPFKLDSPYRRAEHRSESRMISSLRPSQI